MNPLEALRDALARVTRALEALRDGDTQFTDLTLDDLAADLWRAIEVDERHHERKRP